MIPKKTTTENKHENPEKYGDSRLRAPSAGLSVFPMKTTAVVFVAGMKCPGLYCGRWLSNGTLGDCMVSVFDEDEALVV